MPTKTSKTIGIAQAFALAITAALLGTVAHQTVIGGFPLGLTLALLGTLGVALNLRKRNGRTAVTVLAVTLGLLVFWIGMDFHQDKMIPANLWGFVWAYGSIALSAMVAIWPNFSRKAI